MLFDPPYFVRRPAAECRRIQNNAVIFRAAADFTQNEFQSVIFKKPNSTRGNAGKFRVFFRPCVALLRSIKVRHFGARFRRNDARDAGVTKKIKYFRLI